MIFLYFSNLFFLAQVQFLIIFLQYPALYWMFRRPLWKIFDIKLRFVDGEMISY